ACGLTSPRDHPLIASHTQWGEALGDEEVDCLLTVGCFTLQSAQCAKLFAVKRVDARLATFGAAYMHSAGLEFDIVPADCHKLAGAQPMAIGKQDRGRVSVPPTVLPRGVHQPLDLAFREVFALSSALGRLSSLLFASHAGGIIAVAIAPIKWGLSNCYIYWDRCGLVNAWIVHNKSSFRVPTVPNLTRSVTVYRKVRRSTSGVRVSVFSLRVGGAAAVVSVRVRRGGIRLDRLKAVALIFISWVRDAAPGGARLGSGPVVADGFEPCWPRAHCGHPQQLL